MKPTSQPRTRVPRGGEGAEGQEEIVKGNKEREKRKETEKEKENENENENKMSGGRDTSSAAR